MKQIESKPAPTISHDSRIKSYLGIPVDSELIFAGRASDVYSGDFKVEINNNRGIEISASVIKAWCVSANIPEHFFIGVYYRYNSFHFATQEVEPNFLH